MTSNLKVVGQKVLASMTMVVTVLSLSGLAVLTPTAAALAVAPADYGLHEGDVIRATGDIDVYIVNDWGYKRLFVNPAIFNLYGHLGFAAVHEVSPATREAFGTSGLFRNCESGDQKVYGLEVVSEDVANLHWINITGAEAVLQDPNFFQKVFCINNAEQGLYGVGAPYTSLSQVPPYSRGGGSNPTPTPSQGGLNGGAGQLDDATFISSLNNEEVGEGEDNVKVLGYDLDADNGSDLRFTSLRLELENTAPGIGASDNLDDYADSVSVWFGNNKVATVDVSDFNEESGVFSKSISLSGDTVVRMGDTGKLYVAVTAVNNIDSNDEGESWNATVTNIRYVDAQGAVTTDDTTGDIGSARNFTFESFATATDIELKLAEKSDSPDARVVDIDDASNTDGVVLLTATLKAIGSDIDLNEMTVNITADGNGDASEQASQFILEVDGDELDTVSSNACTGGVNCAGGAPGTAEYVFDDADATINEGDTVTVRVLADINEGDTANFSNGDSLLAAIDNDDTDADDQNGDELGTAELTGAVTGEEQAFYTEGIMVTFDSATKSVTANDAPTSDTGNYVIKFKVMAFDTDAYIVNDCVENGAQVNGEGVSYLLDGANGPGASACTFTNTDETAFGNFQVSEGETHTFTLTLAVEGANDFVEAALESINWDDADQASGSMNQFYTFNLDEFKTGSQYLGN